METSRGTGLSGDSSSWLSNRIISPLAPALDVLGHRVLSALIWVTGLWILEPFGLSVGASSSCLFALMLLVGLPAETVFLDLHNHRFGQWCRHSFLAML